MVQEKKKKNRKRKFSDMEKELNDDENGDLLLKKVPIEHPPPKDSNLRYHSLDPWHVVKNKTKDFAKAANKEEDLQLWIKSLRNHLCYSITKCEGDPQRLRELVFSILFHIRGIHKWTGFKYENQCNHSPFTKGQQRDKQWIAEDSSGYEKIRQCIRNTHFLNSLSKTCLYPHTGNLNRIK